jgi:K+-sensing histidine kinase KdpD
MTDDAGLSLGERMERIEDLIARFPPPVEELREEMPLLRAQLMRYEAEKYALRCELAAHETEGLRLAGALAQARRQASEAATLYLATHRLHATLDRAQVLRALEEIVASLLGCEQMAVYERGEGARLVPVSVRGLAPGAVGPLREGEGAIGRAVLGGEVWLAGLDGEPSSEPGLTACIPLRVDGEVMGVIALFALREHRAPLGPADRLVVELLSTHAATALAATRGRRGPDVS